jgi:hypothetical protein
MANTLTNEDKIGLISQHKRNIEMNKYNLELTLIEENALSTPNAETVANITAQVNEAAAKIAALDAELASISE